jgi:hypothetical protein
LPEKQSDRNRKQRPDQRDRQRPESGSPVTRRRWKGRAHSYKDAPNGDGTLGVPAGMGGCPGRYSLCGLAGNHPEHWLPQVVDPAAPRGLDSALVGRRCLCTSRPAPTRFRRISPSVETGPSTCGAQRADIHSLVRLAP